MYNLDFTTSDPGRFNVNCKKHVNEMFINEWLYEQHDLARNPKLRLYGNITNGFGIQPYLIYIKYQRYRNAISKIRASSHTLNIERGRYTRPKTPVEMRLCEVCSVVEDEKHFVTDCQENSLERCTLYSLIHSYSPGFDSLLDYDKFYFLMNNDDPKILKWFGIFLYQSFMKRNNSLITIK